MLCLAQLSAARVSPADLAVQAAVTSIQVADAAGTGGMADVPSDEVSLADLSSELAEPMLPMSPALLPGMSVVQPAAPVAVSLPHPLIEGPQRPPRVIDTLSA